MVADRDGPGDGGVPAPAALTWAIIEMLACANPAPRFFTPWDPSCPSPRGW